MNDHQNLVVSMIFLFISIRLSVPDISSCKEKGFFIVYLKPHKIPIKIRETLNLVITSKITLLDERSVNLCPLKRISIYPDTISEISSKRIIFNHLTYSLLHRSILNSKQVTDVIPGKTCFQEKI